MNILVEGHRNHYEPVVTSFKNFSPPVHMAKKGPVSPLNLLQPNQREESTSQHPTLKNRVGSGINLTFKKKYEDAKNIKRRALSNQSLVKNRDRFDSPIAILQNGAGGYTKPAFFKTESVSRPHASNLQPEVVKSLQFEISNLRRILCNC